MKLRGAVVLLVLGACKPKPAPAPASIDAASPTPIPIVAEIADAAPEASAPAPDAAVAPTAEKAPDHVTMTLVATFASGIRGVNGLRVTDGIALGAYGNSSWDVYTVGRSKPLQNLTSKLTNRVGEPFWIWGTTDEIWLNSSGPGDIHASRTADPERVKMYRHVAPFRGDQWLGVPSKYPLHYLSDDQPNTFEQLHAADSSAEVPTIPKNIQLWTLTSLGEGRLCGVGVQEDAPQPNWRLWWWASASNNKVVPLPDSDLGGGYTKAFRAANGDCVYAYGNQDISARRLRGNHVVPVVDKLPHGPVDVTASGGALWAAEDAGTMIRRVDLNATSFQMTKYALPAEVDGCALKGVDGMAAVADDDIWIVASCAQRIHVLLHTEPAGAPVTKIKAP